MRASRKFRPTFLVTITPQEEVDSGRTSKDQPYSTLRNALVSRDGREDVVRTVMAFGQASSGLAAFLKPGKPVTVAVQHDEGTLRIVGEPRAIAA